MSLGCGGCGLEIQTESYAINGLPSYSYTSNDFYQSAKAAGMHDMEDMTEFECPQCGEKWHFQNARPIMPQVAHG